MRRQIAVVSFVATLVALGAALGYARSWQRHVAEDAAARIEVVTSLLTGMLEQEAGVSGYVVADDRRFLEPYRRGSARQASAFARARRQNADDARALGLIGQLRGVAEQWRVAAAGQIRHVRRSGAGWHVEPADALARKALTDRFRVLHAMLGRQLEERRGRDLGTAATSSTAIVVSLTALAGALGWAILRQVQRDRRRLADAELEYRHSQREFADLVQVVRSEEEAHAILKRHLERSAADLRITVLRSNHSENRLQAQTALPPDSQLAERLREAEPAACVALRLGRRHGHEAGHELLATCEVCHTAGRWASCEPLLVGGRMIGSVLVEHDRPLDAYEDRRLRDSVSQLAPMLANLRNLALAELRAATDSLTGLPNRRAVEDALKRMAAHATRSNTPLAAIAIDVDHFKQINDRYGHDTGDNVLASVGALLADSVRPSDLVGRIGGEEFLILAPATAGQGAIVLAEKLRVAIERESVTSFEHTITASFGVAVLPDNTTIAKALLRLADQALYAAKRGGRNRVAKIDGTPDPSAVEPAQQTKAGEQRFQRIPSPAPERR